MSKLYLEFSPYILHALPCQNRVCFPSKALRRLSDSSIARNVFPNFHQLFKVCQCIVENQVNRTLEYSKYQSHIFACKSENKALNSREGGTFRTVFRTIERCGYEPSSLSQIQRPPSTGNRLQSVNIIGSLLQVHKSESCKIELSATIWSLGITYGDIVMRKTRLEL